jgi:hypothetical protein
METDEVTSGRQPPARPTRRRFTGVTAFATVIGVLVMVNLAKPAGWTDQRRTSREPTSLRIVLIGDASAGTDGCPGGCRTYTEQLAAHLRHERATSIAIEDRSWRTNTWPPATANSVAAFLRADPSMRQAVRSADVLVLALTGSSPTEFVEQLRRLLDEVDWIRHDRPVDLRVVVAPVPRSSGTWAGGIAEAGCQVVASYDGACVNVSELVRHGRLAPTDWRASDGHHHPRLSQHGHDVVARELIGN